MFWYDSSVIGFNGYLRKLTNPFAVFLLQNSKNAQGLVGLRNLGNTVSISQYDSIYCSCKKKKDSVNIYSPLCQCKLKRLPSVEHKRCFEELNMSMFLCALFFKVDIHTIYLAMQFIHVYVSF